MDLLFQKFSQIVGEYPAKTAILDGNRKATYQQLNAYSAQLAAAIINLTQGKNLPILIDLRSDLFGILAILSSIRAGAYYSFVETSAPLEEKSRVITKLSPILLIASRENQNPEVEKQFDHVLYIEDHLKEGFVPILDVHIDPNRLECVYFTSGSTGEPKAFTVNYLTSALRNQSQIDIYQATADDVHNLSMSLAFLWAPVGFWMAFTTGGTVSVFPYNGQNPESISSWLEEVGVTILQIPSRTFTQLIDYANSHPNVKFPSMRVMNVSGERINETTLKEWNKLPNLHFIIRDTLASSETSTYKYEHYEQGAPIPTRLGFSKTPDGVDVKILVDGTFRAEPNTLGTIAVQTPQLFSGYFQDPGRTNAQLLADPLEPGKTWFITGELGMITEDGRLILEGRRDQMVKIRGYRVDMAEVEEHLRTLPEVSNAAVVIVTNKRNEQELFAYVEFFPGQSLYISEIKNRLSKLCNSYKIPNRYMIIDKIPVSTSGKVMVSRLPKPTFLRPPVQSEFVLPATEIEIKIAEIWQDVLEIDQVGTKDNFFELGGDSISFIEMTSRVEDLFKSIVASDFVEHPTLDMLAQSITEQASGIDPHIRPSDDISARYQTKLDLNRANVRKDPLSLLVGVMLRRMTYTQVFDLAEKWSGQGIFQKVFYANDKTIFKKWLEQVPEKYRTGAFKKYVYLRLLRYVARGLIADGKKRIIFGQELAEIDHTFIRSLNAAVLQAGTNHTPERFPLFGFEHLREALDANLPIILVSLHSNVRFNPDNVIERNLGRGAFETVAYNFGTYGKYSSFKGNLTPDLQAASNAEVSLDGVMKIREGKILMFLPDTNDHLTKNYIFPILGRNFSLKGGFAELADLVGAVIIPISEYVTDDFCLAREFHAPLHSEMPKSSERIQDLVRQYANFVEKTYQEHPEVITYQKIKAFFKRDLADPQK